MKNCGMCHKKSGIKNTLLSKQNDWRAKKYYPFLKQALTNIPDHIIDLTEKNYNDVLF